ncbi:MAG: NAD(P)/FAD-dependent oxidoreductase [Alphaproteobacteria bacterium]|nr:NAD(P)/FAD-dependent oxidoreductase [Alphaproteobacteria bacterium]
MAQQRYDRRFFLKAALFASGALAATPMGRARAQTLAGKTVIVVGAGVAGLGAARALKNQGATVIVLEAKDKIGGRLSTDWALGDDAPFEVGAGWIHGPSDENPAKQLTDAVGSTYFVTDDDNLTVFSADGTEWDDEEVEEVAEEWAEAIWKVDSELEYNDRRSLRDAIRDLYPSALNEPGVLWALSAFTEFSKGAPIEDLSAVYHDDDEVYDGADVVVANGYDSLLAPLAEGLDIRTGTPVEWIWYDEGEGVEVGFGDEKIEGDYVICSVPLGVLKKGAIEFEPALPSDVQSDIDGLGFGSVTKLALKFERPFWDIETQYFGIITEEKGRWNYWLNYRTFSKENVLLGLSVGAYAPVADAMTDEQMKADGLEVLRGVWGDAVAEPTQMLATHWSLDPYALGAYAYPRPGGRPSQFNDLQDPIEDRLFLCGEHTTFEYAGTIHGAYMSGLRAAEAVIDEAG